MSRNFVLTAAALLLIAAEANADVDLTGTWSGNDSGTYYIHQLGTVVWWYGEQTRTGPAWGNVAHGRFQDDRLILDWADVPKGQIMSSGELILTIDSPNHLTAVHRTGGFGGSVWIRR